MIDEINKLIKSAGGNMLRYALFSRGKVAEGEFVKTCPCHNMYSISKNFTAAAVGIAADKGLVSLDDYIANIFKDELPEGYDPKLKKVQIKHLLSNTTGLKDGFLFEHDRYNYNTDDWLSLCLKAPLEFDAGEKFAYSNSNFYLLSCIVEKFSGKSTDLFLNEHLFAPLGIFGYSWERCPKGHTMGATGLYLKTYDLLKFGVMIMQNGIFNDKRIVSQKFVSEATRKNSFNSGKNYGYSFWTTDNPQIFIGNGAYGQLIHMNREKNFVFAANCFDNTEFNYNVDKIAELDFSCLPSKTL